MSKFIFIFILAIGFTGCGSLHQSSMDGDLKGINKYLNQGVDVNSLDEYGSTALIDAIVNNHIDTVKLLIDKGADINITTSRGMSALMIASIYGYIDIVKLLVNKSASLNLQNINGDTALLLAVRLNKHPNVIQYLIENNADINIANNANETAKSLYQKNILKNKEYQDFISSFNSKENSTILFYDVYRNYKHKENNVLAGALYYGLIGGLISTYNNTGYKEIDFNIYSKYKDLKETNIGRLTHSTYLKYQTNNKSIKVYSKLDEEKNLQINLEAQKVYCIQVTLLKDLLSFKPSFYLVDNFNCFEAIQQYKLNESTN